MDRAFCLVWVAEVFLPISLLQSSSTVSDIILLRTDLVLIQDFPLDKQIYVNLALDGSQRVFSGRFAQPPKSFLLFSEVHRKHGDTLFLDQIQSAGPGEQLLKCPRK